MEIQLSEKQRSKLPQVTSIGQVRTDRMLDSALAGALTGGVLSATFREAFFNYKEVQGRQLSLIF